MSLVVSSLRWWKHLAALLTGATTAHCSYGEWTLAQCNVDTAHVNILKRLQAEDPTGSEHSNWCMERAGKIFLTRSECDDTQFPNFLFMHRRRVALVSFPEIDLERTCFPGTFPLRRHEANSKTCSKTWSKTNRHPLQGPQSSQSRNASLHSMEYEFHTHHITV